MPASYLQDDFRGGLWTAYQLGRMTDQAYRTALSAALNVIPLEEGGGTRRPGTRYIAATRGGVPAALREFNFQEEDPYNMEFTPGHLRFVSGTNLVLEPTTQQVGSISSDDPAIVTVTNIVEWNTGDEVQFNRPAGYTDNGAYILDNRQFLIDVTGNFTFTINDSITNVGQSGAGITLGPEGLLVSRVLDFATPYLAADIFNMRTVQALNGTLNQVVVLNTNYQPQVLTAVTNPDAALGEFATFTFEPAYFIDGPYLDLVSDGGVATPGNLTGTITVTIGYDAWSSTVTYGIGDAVVFSGIAYVSLVDNNINNEPDVSSNDWQVQNNGASVSPQGFVGTDVGRSMRLFSEPSNWNGNTTYAANTNVKYAGAYWTALTSNKNQEPGVSLTAWAVAADGQAAAWTWGRIQSVVSASEVTLQLLGGALLYTNPINSWQMGRYSNTTGWPSTGIYYQGRLWLVGPVGNHFDGSVSNDIFNFAPTGPDGTVADDNGISETLNDSDVNTIFWLTADDRGMIFGTQGGEFRIMASQLGDPLTPTSIQATKITKYGSANVEGKRTPLAMMAVQRGQRKVLEYVTDLYSGKSVAQNLSLKAQALILDGGGVQQLAYQQERTPILWVLLNSGQLIGCTYKRELAFGTTPPTFAGWHPHILGTARNALSIQTGPSVGGTTDSLTMVTQPPGGGTCWLELLTDIFPENGTLPQAWFLDGADLPFGMDLNPEGIAGPGIRLYGYYYLANQRVTVWAGGLDMGDLLVSATGYIDVLFGSDPNGLFTLEYLDQLTAEGTDAFNGLAVFVNNGTPSIIQQAPEVGGIGEFFINTYNYSTGGVANGAIDWKNALFWVAGSDSDSNPGLSQYTVPGMAASGSVSTANFWASRPNDNSADKLTGTGVTDQAGNMYFYASGSQNSGRVARATIGMTLGGFFGSHSGTENSGSGGMALPQSMCCLSLDQSFIVQVSLLSGNALFGGSGAELAVWNGSIINNVGTVEGYLSSFGADQPQGPVAAGITTNDGLGHYYGEAYALMNSYGEFANGNYLDGHYTKAWSLWRIAITHSPPSAATIGYTNVASITPADIDPTWSWFSDAVDSIAVDLSDGNVISFATGNQTPGTWVYDGNLWEPGYVVLGSNGHAYKCILAVGNQDPTTDGGTHWTDLGAYSAPAHGSYIFKLNRLTGALIWKIPIPAPNVLVSESSFNQSQINGFVALHTSSSTVLWIDTATGTIVETLAIQDVTPQGQQMSGPLGLITAVDYSDTGGPPTPVPVFPCTGTFTNHWGYFEAIPSIPTQLLLPVVVGYDYVSQGQIPRPIAPQEAGSPTGPALAKSRRTAEVGFLFAGTSGQLNMPFGGGVTLGTDFITMHPADFLSGGPFGDEFQKLSILSLYNDIYWDKVENAYSFDSEPAWQVTRPYPCTVLAIEAFVSTAERG